MTVDLEAFVGEAYPRAFRTACFILRDPAEGVVVAARSLRHRPGGGPHGPRSPGRVDGLVRWGRRIYARYVAGRDTVGVQRACSHCGTVADACDDGVPDGWSFAVDNDRITYQCPDCVRANIRAIEGKLPEEWW